MSGTATVRMRAAIVLLAVASAVSAAELRVTADCPWIDRDGYSPVLVTLVAEAETRVQLHADHDGGAATMTVELPAGMPVQRTVLVPTNPTSPSTSIIVRWASGLGRGEVQISGKSHRSADLLVVDPEGHLAGNVLGTDYNAAMPTLTGNSGAKSGWYGSGSYDVAKRRIDLPPESLPDRWQGYPSWLCLVLTPSADRRLTQAQREAIATWCAAGGALFLTDEAQLAPWRAFGVNARRFAPAEPAAMAERVKQTLEAGDFMPERMGVPGVGQVPVIAFSLVVLVFALLAGPGLLWWTARRQQRHLLLVLVPVLSLGTSALLVVWGLVGDGLGVRRSLGQVVLLDHGRAVAWTAASYFAGLSPGTIELDPQDLAMAMDQADWEHGVWRDRRWNNAIAWDGGQRLSGTWIPARVVRQLTWISARPERRRLAFTRTATGWQVLNGTDRVVTSLSLHRDGRWTTEGPLEPGASATLTRADTGADDPIHERRFGPAFILAHRSLTGGGWYHARFDGLLIPPPGPAGDDRNQPTTDLFGRVDP